MSINPRLMLGAAACALFLAGCSSDGLTVGASNGVGASVPGSSQVPPDNSADGSGGGDSSTTGGGGGSTSGGGVTGGGGGSSGVLGNGTVTVTAGGTTATTPNLPAGSGLVGKANNNAGALLNTGNALLPTGTAANAVQPVASRLPATATVNNTTVGGPATQPVGVSVLSNTQAPGSVAAVGAASAGQTGTVSVNPGNIPGASSVSGVVSGQSAIANVTAARQNIVTGANPVVGASVVSPTQNQGSLATVGVGANGNGAVVSTNGGTLLNTGTLPAVPANVGTPRAAPGMTSPTGK